MLKNYLRLFLTFARIGGFTFGGGYAMLPLLQREVVEKYGWTTEEELMDYYAVGQCTPGVIAVNVATFIGKKLYGIPGGIIATLGVVAPSVIIITLIAALISNFFENEYVIHALGGIRAVVCALIAQAVIKMTKTGVKDWVGAVIFVATLAVLLVFSISPIIVVACAIALGLIIEAAKGYAAKKGAQK